MICAFDIAKGRFQFPVDREAHSSIPGIAAIKGCAVRQDHRGCALDRRVHRTPARIALTVMDQPGR